ncbi:hypothetical protein [Fimbriiglobus ruber]|uniref:Uncharacterized protein n=1 Tax=Fimbriiglobus ruber TaxID=1908690 RepID=A0A225EA64_9BACT|nr:hypothetical protein [Fimbriiglobus ruber]OWK45455.1 hypothetical protein FRUB_01786 [Fimbriiglobus ruber]
MKTVKFLISTAAAAGLAGSAVAQPPATDPISAAASPYGVGAQSALAASAMNAVAPPAPLAQGIAPQPALPGGPTIWSKLGISQDQQEYCRRKTCGTPYGQMMSTLVNPLSNLTCGIILQYCPALPSLAQLMDPGAIGAASKVKMDRAGCQERIKAIKYLATVDCHYWPEAEEALIGALRATATSASGSRRRPPS